MIPNVFTLAASVLAFSGAALASTPCTTVEKGSLAIFTSTNENTTLSINTLGQMTIGNGTNPVRAEFQNCPDASQGTGYNYNGRIIIFAPESVNGDCLTLVYDAANPRYYADAKPCVGEYVPEDTQFWGLGNDFGDVIFWAGSSFCADGAILNSQSGDPALGPWGQLIWECAAIGQSYENIKLVGPA